MLIHLTTDMAESLSAFLNRKQGERQAATKRKFTIRAMADEIGMHERTLGRLMAEDAKFSGIEPETFQILYRAFGDEFLAAVFEVDPDSPATFKVKPGD